MPVFAMALFNNFRLGVRSYGDAHRFIRSNRLWGYVFLPALINGILLTLIVLAGWHLISSFTSWFFDVTGLSGEQSGWLSHLFSFLRFLIKALFWMLLFILYSYIYKYLVLIILSPMLAVLSEKTSRILTGAVYPFSFKNFIHDVWRGIRIALRNMFIELGWIILFYFVSFIPVIGFISPVYLFLVSCYFYGFSMIDYSNERDRLSVKQSVRFVRKNRGLAIANGMIFYVVFFFIPVIGFLIAPAYAIIAATLAVNKTRQAQTVVTA